MIFLYEVKLQEDKRIDNSLQLCFGIGKFISKCFLAKLGFNFKIKQKMLNKSIVKYLDVTLIKFIDNILYLKIEIFAKNLLYNQMIEVKNKMNLKSLKHLFKLPVRGQRTKNNAQTQKKKRPNWRRVPVSKKKKKNE